ncbi:hypothetical protein J2792_002371 [Novosphingobium capsulatum]|uniref:Uncharacterized protein n=1 Tax=Novosphingobium capsulatum TaxID=13688 RepID=A0ABU1MMD9_9SPHN|nr:hypothetical protein [Novosphingobium capsulatum]MDR6511499.1 hypothetical protein [Novosphingobium capsulatum]
MELNLKSYRDDGGVNGGHHRPGARGATRRAMLSASAPHKDVSAKLENGKHDAGGHQHDCQPEGGGGHLGGAPLLPVRKRRQDGVADQFGDLRDYGVSEGLESKLVQSSSKPIIHSAKRLSDLFPRRFPTSKAKMIGMPGEQRWNCEGGAVIFPASFTVGVGNKPPTVSLVGRAKVPSWYAVPFRIIPDLGQRPQNVSKPSTKQLCDVFQHDMAGSNFANQSNDFKEKSASFTIKTFGFPGDGNVLAWEAPTDDINGNSIGSKSFAGKLAHVVVAGDFGPVLGKDAAGKFFDFAERDGFEAIVMCSWEFGALKAQRKPPYTRKKIEDVEWLTHAKTPERALCSESSRRISNGNYGTSARNLRGLHIGRSDLHNRSERPRSYRTASSGMVCRTGNIAGGAMPTSLRDRLSRRGSMIRTDHVLLRPEREWSADA